MWQMSRVDLFVPAVWPSPPSEADPPPRFTLRAFSGQALPPWYDVTPMLEGKTAMKFVPYATLVLVPVAGANHQWLPTVLLLASAIIWVGDIFDGIENWR